jgi:hypothetical protein
MYYHLKQVRFEVDYIPGILTRLYT